MNGLNLIDNDKNTKENRFKLIVNKKTPHKLKEFIVIRKYGFEKRFLDIVLILITLPVLIPIFILVILAIRIDSKGKAFYKQERVGKHGKTFQMYKFRSMVENADSLLKELEYLNEADGPVFKIREDPRITRVGKFIRRHSIDELPQLINVMKGDMTLVGPRPPLVKEVEKYNVYQMQRLSVTPGLTCYWQINGRSEVSFDEWVEYDLKYIQEQNMLIDLKILFRTIKVVACGDGAY